MPRAAAVRPPVAAWAPYSDAEPAAAAAAPQEGPPPPALKPLRQYVHVEGADGATLFGQVCDGRRGLVGVVLLSPHPTFGGSRATLEPAYAALAAAGCSVLAYDVRGSGKSTGRRTWSRRAERQDAIACARCVGVHMLKSLDEAAFSIDMILDTRYHCVARMPRNGLDALTAPSLRVCWSRAHHNRL